MLRFFFFFSPIFLIYSDAHAPLFLFLLFFLCFLFFFFLFLFNDRNRDIFILAANYLQNLDWHSNQETMKSIITFYTKAKAFEQLSSFYDACANVEIDEYRDYSKALGALNEAERYLSKARNTPAATKQERLAVRLFFFLFSSFSHIFSQFLLLLGYSTTGANHVH